MRKLLLLLMFIVSASIVNTSVAFQPSGSHYFLDLWKGNFPETKKQAEFMIRKATEAAHGTPLLFGSALLNPGLTAFGILKESHISIHTWPEHEYAAVDVFTCGNTDAQKAVEYIVALLRPQKMNIRLMERGLQKPLFGQELIIDLHGCNDALFYKDRILFFNIELCKLLQVQRYGTPFLERFALHDPDLAGYSLAQMIETSLVSAHFSEKNRSAYINIFSCKMFDAYKALAFTKEFFGAKKVNYQILLR